MKIVETGVIAADRVRRAVMAARVALVARAVIVRPAVNAVDRAPKVAVVPDLKAVVPAAILIVAKDANPAAKHLRRCRKSTYRSRPI